MEHTLPSTESYEIKDINISNFINQLQLNDDDNYMVACFFETRKDSVKDKSADISPNGLLNATIRAYNDFMNIINSKDDSKYERVSKLSYDKYGSIGIWADIREVLTENLPVDFGAAFVSLDIIRLRAQRNEVNKQTIMKAMLGNSKESNYTNEIKKLFESDYLDNRIASANELNKETTNKE